MVDGAGLGSFEQDNIEGENPVPGWMTVTFLNCLRRVELFGNAAQNGW